MLLRAADLDVIRARRNYVGEAGIRVELGAELVEIGDIDLGTLAHDAFVGFQFAEDQPQQRRLAGAVGANDADLVAALDAGREIANNLPLDP